MCNFMVVQGKNVSGVKGESLLSMSICVCGG